MIESLDEKALFIEMDRENRQRADLRPYEQGLMYKRALDQGLFSSLRKLAEETGADASNVSKAIKITELPEQVLNVFAARASVLDIQYGWSRQLHKLYKSDPDVLLARVKDIEDLPKINNYTAAGVYRMLIGKSPFSGDDRLMTALVALSTNSRTVDVGSQKYELVYNSEMTSVKLGRLNAAKLEKLEKFLSGLLKDD
jgi:ParB family chromosome partitioning protein